METSSYNILTYIIGYFFVLPIAAAAAAKGVALDAKLAPEKGEDETRIVKEPEPTARANRSFCRRWLRAANYREENIERALEGKPVDNCPRLTRAKRNLWKSLHRDYDEQSAERKAGWRETGDNQQRELARQSVRREIEAEANFHATVTIDDVVSGLSSRRRRGYGRRAGDTKSVGELSGRTTTPFC